MLKQGVVVVVVVVVFKGVCSYLTRFLKYNK